MGNILFLVHICTVPWYVTIGVFTVIGQPSKQVAFVTHKSEAVSNPGAGRQAVPGCSRFQLLPQPATRLGHMGPKSTLENLPSDRDTTTSKICDSLT